MSEHNHAFLSAMLSLVLQIQPCQLGDSETSGWHDWHTHLLYQKAGRARPGGPFGHCARRNWWRAHQKAHNELSDAQNKRGIVWATFCCLLCWEKVAPTQSSAASVIFGRYHQLEELLHPFVHVYMIVRVRFSFIVFLFMLLVFYVILGAFYTALFSSKNRKLFMFLPLIYTTTSIWRPEKAKVSKYKFLKTLYYRLFVNYKDMNLYKEKHFPF